MRERVGSWLIAACLTFAMASPAWADAKVSVELKAKDGSPTDGEVLLTKGDAKFSCKTSAGHCEISGVPQAEAGDDPAQRRHEAHRERLLASPSLPGCVHELELEPRSSSVMLPRRQARTSNAPVAHEHVRGMTLLTSSRWRSSAVARAR